MNSASRGRKYHVGDRVIILSDSYDGNDRGVVYAEKVFSSSNRPYIRVQLDSGKRMSIYESDCDIVKKNGT